MPIHTLSDSLGGSGAPIEFICSRGDKYKFSLLTLGKQSEFERALESRELARLRDLREALGEEEYKAQVKELLREFKHGEYAFGGENCSDALSSLWGVSTLIGILGGISSEQAHTLIQENVELRELIEMIIERSFPVMSKKKQELVQAQTGHS